jgi:predicted O-methyltransferase YrrM
MFTLLHIIIFTTNSHAVPLDERVSNNLANNRKQEERITNLKQDHPLPSTQDATTNHLHHLQHVFSTTQHYLTNLGAIVISNPPQHNTLSSSSTNSTSTATTNNGIIIPFKVDNGNVDLFILSPENLIATYNNSVLNAFDQLCTDAKIFHHHCILDMIQHVQESFATATAQQWLLRKIKNETTLPIQQAQRFPKHQRHHVDYTLKDVRRIHHHHVAALSQLFPEEELMEGHLLSDDKRVPPERIQCLSFAASLLNAKTYLEVGFNRGHGTAALLTAVPSIKEVLEFDTCVNLTASRLAIDFFRTTFPNTRLTLICGNSKDTVPKFTDGDDVGGGSNTQRRRTFDLIHIDGLHNYENTIADIRNCQRLAHQKTILVIDDAGPAGTEDGGWVSIQVNLAIAYAVSQGLVEFVSPGMCQHGQLFLRYL